MYNMLLLPKRNKYNSCIVVTYKIIAQVIVSTLEGVEMILCKSCLFLLQPLSNKQIIKILTNIGTLTYLNTAPINMLNLITFKRNIYIPRTFLMKALGIFKHPINDYTPISTDL